MFKIGDKIRLKKEFYKEEVFKGMSRSLKKPIAYLQGKSVSVVSVPNFNRNDVAIIVTDGVDIYIFPPCIFELAEPEKKAEELNQYIKVGDYVKILSRKWTPEEIVQAQCFLAGELIYAKCKFVYDHNSNRTACYNYETGKSAEAKCSPNDMFNPYIGAVVAYCKTCGVKIPEFITK